MRDFDPVCNIKKMYVPSHYGIITADNLFRPYNTEHPQGRVGPDFNQLSPGVKQVERFTLHSFLLTIACPIRTTKRERERKNRWCYTGATAGEM